MSNTKKYIRVDMDYSSNPVWFSEDGKDFINGDVSDLNITEDLALWLEFYRKMWENEVGRSEFNENFSSDVTGVVYALQISLAIRLKEELPDSVIYVWDNETSSNKVV